LFAIAQKEIPAWQTITLRTASGGPGGKGGAGTRGPGRAANANANTSATGESPTANSRTAGAPSSERATPAHQAVSFTVREAGTWPRTATTTVSLNPYTGDVVRRTGFADMNAAQQVRSWTRFLHTGEALGKVGQFVAGLACLGGLFLVYTGFALSWRRFFGKSAPVAAASRRDVETAEPGLAGRVR
jgi:uncharacterized iron-regulated membrane protein